MSDLGRLEPPAHWHDLSEREQRLFAKLEFLAEGRVARTPMVAATVIRNNWGWNMTILPRRRGLRYPVNFATLLGFSPSPYHPERDTLQALRGRLEVDAVAERFRDEIFRLGEPVFDQLAAYFEDPRRAEDAEFPTLFCFHAALPRQLLPIRTASVPSNQPKQEACTEPCRSKHRIRGRPRCRTAPGRWAGLGLYQP